MIVILCDDSTSCKEACDNNDYHRSRQQQTFKMSIKLMRISLDHFIYCIVLYKCKTIFSICGSIISIICTLLYPRYEVYRGYIVFAFSVIMFVCLFVCLSVNFFFRQRFLSNYLG